MQDVPYIHALHIRHPHAHQRDRQQAGLMHHLVGGNEDAQHARQCRQVVQVFRQPLAAHDLPQYPATGDAEQAAAEDDAAEGQQAVAQTIARRTGDDEAIHHYRQQCANRVDDDAFPAQDIGDGGFGAYHAQHGHDHRRAGHQSQRAEQQREHPVKTQQPVGGQGDHRPGREGADGDQSVDDAADFLPFRQVQGQAALKQDQRHCQRHQRHQQRAEHFLRVEPSEYRPCQNPAQQKKQNRRQFQAPGQPLAAECGHANAAKSQQNLLFVH